MLKYQKIGLLNLKDSERLQNFLEALQAEVNSYEGKYEILPMIAANNFDFLIVHISQPAELEFVRSLIKSNPSVHTICVTSSECAQYIRKSQIQVHGLICLEASFDEYLHCFWQLNDGYFYCSFTLNTNVQPASLNENDNMIFNGLLSKRERELFALLGEGLTNQEISDQLFISPETVKNHKKNMIAKLNLKSTNELILLAGQSKAQWRQQLSQN